MSVELICDYVEKFVESDELLALQPFVKNIDKMLHEKTGQGAQNTGWLDLPEKTDIANLNEINDIAEEIRKNSEIFIIIGIGGSYLGARACIEFLHSHNYNLLRQKNAPKILFAGNNLNSNSLREILQICGDKEISINVISKSGGTLEPLSVFAIFKDFMEKKYGEQAKNRIFCTTNSNSGHLLEISKQMGYKNFCIPDDIGGRFSCFTPVGLLPIAVSGGDIYEIIKGAQNAQKELGQGTFNDCYKYAAIRNILYKKGKIIEILAGYEPKLECLFSWWKQLFGESEGKNHMGIFPSSAIFTTDLHSLGQLIQDGSRNIFETILSVKNPTNTKRDSSNLQDENNLCYKKLSKLNTFAENATLKAHVDGGVPNILLKINDFSEFTLGYLIYFFEKACAMSGYLLGVNPFNQPGVELYKKNIDELMRKDSEKGL